MSIATPQFPYLSVEKAAAALSVTEGRVRQILRAGELHGEKLGRHAWAIPVAEIERYQAVRHGPGRRPSTA
jgi:excisionase family DNA binding protein